MIGDEFSESASDRPASPIPAPDWKKMTPEREARLRAMGFTRNKFCMQIYPGPRAPWVEAGKGWVRASGDGGEWKRFTDAMALWELHKETSDLKLT